MIHIPFNDVSGHYDLTELSVDHTDYLSQIAGQDRVHTFGAQTVDELCEYRIGGDASAKTAFAVVNTDTQKVGAVIFGHKTKKTINTGADLQGNVAEILREKASAAFEGTPTAMVFYTISAFTRGAGPLLVNTLIRHTDGFQPATLSPLRTLRDAYPNVDVGDLKAEEKTVLAFMHLLNREDPVQKFHMGNGAIIRDIKLDANDPDSEDGIKGLGVMVNYGYTGDLNTLSANKSTLSAINAGSEPREALLELMEPALSRRLMTLVSGGVLKTLQTPRLPTI